MPTNMFTIQSRTLLIGLRVDTSHVAADLDFLADFLIEVWDGLGGVLRADCMWARLCPQIKVPHCH
jgi:hypothetical protein